MSDQPNIPAPLPSPMDRLNQESRTYGVSRMIPDDLDPKMITEDMAGRLIAKINLFKRERPACTNAYIARAVGFSNAVISTVLRQAYKGDWRPIIKDLDRWLDAEVKREAAPKVSNFVWTKVAEEIRDIADAAIMLRKIGLVYGPTTSGIGKTLALRALALDKPGTIMITVNKTAASVRGMLRTLCRAVKASDEGSDDDRFRRVVDKLSGTPRLLIVDQIHNLCGCAGDKPLFVLTELWDETQSPQLWCGTKDLVSYLDRKQARGEDTLAQIRRRIAIRRDLMARTTKEGGGDPLFTIEEIRQIFGKGKMRLATDAAQWLHRLACLPDSGALGECTKTVEAAVALYGKNESLITAAMLKTVSQTLTGWRQSELVDADLAAEPERIARSA